MSRASQPAAGVTKLAGQRGQGQIRLHRGVGRGDGQGQRQPCAQVDQLGGHTWLGCQAFSPETLGQQLVSLSRAEQVQRHRMRAFRGDQAGELVAAGDQDQTGQAAGQQRTDLLGVAGVVQDDQHPPVRQQAAIQVLLGFGCGRDLAGRHPQRVKEPADCVRRCDRVP